MGGWFTRRLSARMLHCLPQSRGCAFLRCQDAFLFIYFFQTTTQQSQIVCEIISSLRLAQRNQSGAQPGCCCGGGGGDDDDDSPPSASPSPASSVGERGPPPHQLCGATLLFMGKNGKTKDEKCVFILPPPSQTVCWKTTSGCGRRRERRETGSGRRKGAGLQN